MKRKEQRTVEENKMWLLPSSFDNLGSQAVSKYTWNYKQEKERNVEH